MKGHPGEPGKPGKPGIGGGGTGGQGGSGGKGGDSTKTTWGQHRYLAGYLLLVAAAIVAAQLHSTRTQHRLEKVDQRSCTQRLVISKNQLDVFDSLLTARAREPRLDPAHIATLKQDRLDLLASIARGC